MRNQQQQERSGNSMRGGVNLLYLLVCGHAACFTVFTRHSFGVETLGINGVAALGLILGYICFTGSPSMVPFLAIWFVALATQRLITHVRTQRGWYEHSRYEGYPWLGFKVPFVRRVEGAKLWEMLFCFIAGTLLLGIDEALGRFVFFGVFSLMGKAAIEGQVEQNRLQRMRDAEIEMRSLVDRFNQRDF